MSDKRFCAGADDDCTRTGVAVEITQMGTNNTYLLPADDAAAQPRFDAAGKRCCVAVFCVWLRRSTSMRTARARAVLGDAGADCDPVSSSFVVRA